MLDTLALSYSFCLIKSTIKKSRSNVFKYKKLRVSTALILQGYPLNQVSECFYLGILLMDNLACTSDVERP